MAKAKKKEQNQRELHKLKKKELLEIMLAQGEEIDSLREENEELKKRLKDRELKMEHIGSIAEASLAVTKIFEEADEAAKTYLKSIRSRYV